MKDQSHKEEMSSLLQADFARLRARGIATTLAPQSAEPAPLEEAPAVAVDPPKRAPVTVVDPPQATLDPAPADGWLKRLLRTP